MARAEKNFSKIGIILAVVLFGALALFFVSRQANAEEPQPVSAPAEGEPNVVPLQNIGDGNFQDYYHFGKISVELEAVKNVFQAGEEAKFRGFLINNNEYPIFGGQVYVQILQQNEKDSDANGDHLRDQFFVEKIVALGVGERLPFEFNWKVPQNLPTDKYKAVFSFVVAKKYNMAGLSFVNNIYAGIAPFEIKNQPENQSLVLIDRSNVLLNGQKIIQRAFIPVVRGNEGVRYEVPIRNLSSEKSEVVLTQRLYYWDGLDSQNKISEKSQAITLSPNETYIFEYQQKEISQPVYFLTLEARDGGAKSIINLRFGTDKNPRARINYSGLTKFPLKKGESYIFFTNFHSTSENSAPQSEVIVSLKDKKGKIIETLNYRGDIPGSIQLKKKELKAAENYDYLVIESVVKNKDGAIVDSASVTLDTASLSEYKKQSAILDWIINFVRNQSFVFQVLIGGLFIVLMGLLLLLIYRIGRRSNNRDLNSHIPGVVVLLLLVFSYSFYYVFFRKQQGVFNEVRAATVAEANTANTTVSWSGWWGSTSALKDPAEPGKCESHKNYSNFSMQVNYLTYLGNNDYRADTTNLIPLGKKISGGVAFNNSIGKSNADWIITSSYYDTPPAYFVQSLPAYSNTSPMIQDSISSSYTVCGTWKDYWSSYSSYIGKQARVLSPVYIKQPGVTLIGSGSMACAASSCEAKSLGAGTVSVSITPADFIQYYYNKVYDSSGAVIASFYRDDISQTVASGKIPAMQKTFNFNVVQIVPKVDIKVNDSDGPVTIPYNTSATLTWTSSDAASCSASDAWSGTKSLSSYENDDPTASLLSQFGSTWFGSPYNPYLPYLVDNNNTTSGWYWSASYSSGGATMNAWIKADLGLAGDKAYRRARVNANWVTSVSGSLPQVVVQYSDNNSTWTKAGASSLAIAAGGAAWYEALWPDVGSRRYWRFNISTSAPVTGTLQIYEIEFYTQTKAESTGNLTNSKTFTLTCSSSSGGSASDSVTVNVPSLPAAPDFIPLNAKASSLIAGDQITFSADIKNQGTGVADASKAVMRLDIDNNGSFDSYTPSPYLSVDSLTAGSSQTISWPNAWTAAAGTHKLRVEANVWFVSESNTTNNVLDWVFTITQKNQAPIAVAQISTNGTNYSNAITVTKGVPTAIYLGSAGSSDPNGWTDAVNGVSTDPGKCAWNGDLDRSPSPSFEQQIAHPASVSSCNIALGSRTFNDSPGAYTYQVLRITDKPGAVSNVATVQITVQASSYTLSATRSGTGIGTVTSTSNPNQAGQVDCGSTCSVIYNSGASVTLTETPSEGSVFTGWSGCDSVDGNVCTVAMNSSKNVTATFSAIPSDFSVRALNGIYVTLAKGGSNTTDSSKTDVLVEPVWGFNKDVSLSASSGISGTVYSFTPQILLASKYSAGSKFSVSVPNNTTPGIYPITIIGNAGGIIRTTTININVETKDPVFIEI